ncbi:HAD hydrolase-like protein, partial [Methanocalculus natronophilus]|uniref:HAD hydrolase-like protein n=1 Tax=Methanocalculus natronophilus TaxID=1262400 RepID=UPI0031B605FC
KPAKDACVHALNQFKDWNQALMIGDNDSDILSGKNANILTAGVIWSIKGKETLEEAKPDYMLESMYSLLDILKEDGGK